MKYLKLIRVQNLLMIALMQVLFRYTYLKAATYTSLTPSGNFLSLSQNQFILLILSTICIAAAGYIINDIMDQDNDEIAKPSKRIVGTLISESRAYNLYAIFNIIGVGIGFYLSNSIGKKGLFTIFILIAALLYIYSTYLKRILLIGNITVASILAFSILILGVFDLYPAIFDGNKQQMRQAFSILLDYALFAFILNFIREIVKDGEDVEGDQSVGIKSLPILLGKEKTAKVLMVLTLVPIFLLIYYINSYLLKYNLIIYYAFVFLLAPLLYSFLKLWSAKTTKDFKHLSSVFKLIILFGILSIVVLTYDITHFGK